MKVDVKMARVNSRYSFLVLLMFDMEVVNGSVPGRKRASSAAKVELCGSRVGAKTRPWALGAGDRTVSVQCNLLLFYKNSATYLEALS